MMEIETHGPAGAEQPPSEPSDIARSPAPASLDGPQTTSAAATGAARKERDSEQNSVGGPSCERPVYSNPAQAAMDVTGDSSRPEDLEAADQLIGSGRGGRVGQPGSGRSVGQTMEGQDRQGRPHADRGRGS